MKSQRKSSATGRIALAAVLLTGLCSCGGGGPGEDPLQVALFNFAPGFGGVALNAPLVLTFTSDVDGGSVTPDTIRIFTTTTTTAEPDPGAPAVGDYVTSANVVTFLPRIPRKADLSDAGLRIGFAYAIQIPAAPDVIAPVRSVGGKPNVVPFQENFSTINHTILPAPGDITAEPNLNVLHQFFIDEGIENGTDPCDRQFLPPASQASPQVVDTDPLEGETGFGTITGIAAGIGTAFVRLDPISVEFSEPVSPWRIRTENISIRNENLLGETFDLFFFFTQDRSESVLQITVFDKDSQFDQASVPQGRFTLTLTEFTDLAGNSLIDSSSILCPADGVFNLSFSTVSSPALPTDIVLTFEDDDQDGHVDVGGLGTPVRDVNEFPTHQPPFLGGMAYDVITPASPSAVTTSANWGDIGYWNGREMLFDNGFDPADPNFAIPDALKLRGGTDEAATAILTPVAGKANGASDPSLGSSNGFLGVPGSTKFDFDLEGAGPPARIFTGGVNSGPIIYQVRRFSMRQSVGGTSISDAPIVNATTDSVFPMIFLVEEDVEIIGTIDVSGTDGDFGFDGDNNGGGASRNPGGARGLGVAGAGDGGAGGVFRINTAVASDRFGDNGQVPANVFGRRDELSEAILGIGFAAPGGGGRYRDPIDGGTDSTADIFAGGGGGHNSDGFPGGDLTGDVPGITDHGYGGKAFGNRDFTSELGCTGAPGGGGGSADDDGTGTNLEEPDFSPGDADDGGGGGGGGGGFFSIVCGGDFAIGFFDEGADANDPADDIIIPAVLRATGGRGGSTFAGVDPVTLAITDPDQGSGGPGGGGAGGGMVLIAAGSTTVVAADFFFWGKLGGDVESIEGGNRVSPDDEGGSGGGGRIYLADGDGFDGDVELINNPNVRTGGDPVATGPDEITITPIPSDPGDPATVEFDQFTGVVTVTFSEYGDEGREVMTSTMIVTEFFDTLSDSVIYDNAHVLSNSDQARFVYANTDANSLRVIRVFIDATTSVGGFPNLTDENPVTGDLDGGSIGATEEVNLLSDATGTLQLTSQSDAIYQISASADINMGLITPSGVFKNRFVRQRILFDLTNVDLTVAPVATSIFDVFAIPGAAPTPIAPGNSLSNTDSAPAGVPAVAELRVRFIP